MKTITSYWIWISLGVSPVLLAQVGPDYQRPEVETGLRYKSASGSMREARPADSLSKGPWWQVFRDARLNDLMLEAARNNRELKAAMARFDQANAARRTVRSAMAPSISTGFTADQQRTSENMPSPFPLDGLRYDGPGYNLPLEFSWELDLWGKLRRQNEAATAQLEASAAGMHAVLLRLQAELAGNYFQLRAVDRELLEVEKAIALRQESLEITAARVKAGAGNDLDLAQAETQLATTRAEVSGLKIQRDSLENAIAILLGRNPVGFTLAKSGVGLAAPPQIPSGVPSDLLERRPDIAQAERLVAAASAEIGVARAAAFPSLRLLGRGASYTGEFDLLADPASLMWNVGPSLNVPLFSGGRLRAGQKRSIAAHEEALAGYQQVILTAFGEVENSLSAIRHLQVQAVAMQEAAASAEKALKLARSRYELGTSPYLEVIEADRSALTVQRGLTQLQGQRLLAAVNLVKALGGGWEATAVNAAANGLGDGKTPAPAGGGAEAEALSDTAAGEKKGFFSKMKSVFKR
jgi:multidrug efflux system outer membrane protein